MFKRNFSLRTLPELPVLSLFYRDVFIARESISKHTAVTKDEIKKGILYNNHEVTIGGKSVVYKQWYDAGVKTRHPTQGRKVLDVYRIQFHKTRNKAFSRRGRAKMGKKYTKKCDARAKLLFCLLNLLFF